VNLVDTFQDIKLFQRAESVNDLNNRTDCILISIHSDGAGNGRDWYDAKGTGVFVHSYPSDTTLKFADIVAHELEDNFNTPFRGIRYRNFAILRETNCPAVLIEFGFHTHKEECAKMLTEEWKENVVKTVVNTINKFEKL
jgi:N-acetylmuramoyl-L-alanine amidase